MKRSAGETPLSRFLYEIVERYSLDSEHGTHGNQLLLESHVGHLVDVKLESAVARLLKDQTYVELETAERVAERALKWAKITGVILAVPAAIFVGLFSFLGVKTYFDLRDVGAKIAGAETTIVLAEKTAEQSQETSKALIDQTAQLKSRLIEAESIVARLRDLEDQVPQLVERQRELEEKFKTIAGGRIKLGSSVLDLEQPFKEYLKHLDAVGFPISETEITVVRSDEGGHEYNAYYNPSDSTVVLGRKFWYSVSTALREYTHHVLLGVGDMRPISGVYAELETALADYYPSSFLDSPLVGEGVTDFPGRGKNDNFVRSLGNNLRFGDFSEQKQASESSNIYSDAQVWGGLLWDLRGALGSEKTDQLLLTLWQTLPGDVSNEALRVWFSATLLENAIAEATTNDELTAVR